MNYQIEALDPKQFEHLFGLSNAELPLVQAQRSVVTACPGSPCRVSLADAEVEETVILVNYEYQSGDSPYRASHAVFVRENATQAVPAINAVPLVMTSRLMSIRAFDANDCMVDADAVDGPELETAIPKMLSNDAVEYLHLHYAKPGCFAAKVVRVT
ncbi:MAG: hypothetical protein ACI9J2_002533 [Saprospiraceae bacterium]|jgi:hypothetical protein